MSEPRLTGELLTEAGEWIWEQLQEEGFQIAGEIIDLVLETERELGIQARPLDEIARLVGEEFKLRGIAGSPAPLDVSIIRAILDWEDEFLGFAGIPRNES